MAVGLFHLGKNEDDKFLLKAVRCALGKTASEVEVRSFLLSNFKPAGQNEQSSSSNTIEIMRYLLHRRTRVYNDVRDQVSKFYS